MANGRNDLPAISPQCFSLCASMLAENDIRVALVAFGCLALSACSTGINSQAAYIPPTMPTMEAVAKGVKQAADEAKLKPPLQISDLRQTDHGPGRFMLCMHATDPKSNLVVAYAVFFDSNEYKGERLPVILDECEKQSYRLIP
jgi:hypothetical protein